MLTSIICFAIIVRIPGLPFVSKDYTVFLSRWFDYIKLNGGFNALKNPIGDYTQPYLYLLTLGTYTNVNKLFYIKAVSFVFEIMTAFYVMKIINIKYKSQRTAYLSFGLLLFLPTVIFNGSIWAQCDIIYTAFVIGSIYYLLCDKSIAAIFFYGIALSFKLQAIFILPLFGVLLFKNRVKIYQLSLIPATYMLSSIPSLIVGKPLKSILFTYVHQTGEYKKLTYNAPSIYQWLPDKLSGHTTLITNLGILSAFIVVLAILYMSVKYIKILKYDNILELSLLLACIVPFLLPRMHERYFFMADVLSLLYAFCFPRKFYIALIVPLISLYSYLPFLYGASNKPLVALSVLLFVLIVDLLYSFRRNLIKVQ